MIDPRVDAEFAGGNTGVYAFTIIPPAAVKLDFYWRFRLDYGEDVGQIQQVDPDLIQEKGPAQFGEVEDYSRRTHPVPSLGPVGRGLLFLALLASHRVLRLRPSRRRPRCG